MNARQIRLRALEVLEGRYGLGFGVLFVNLVISSALHGITGIGSIASLILAGPLMLGVSSVFLKMARREPAEFEQMFSGFRRFGVALRLYLLIVLFVFLWTLLLIVPGIIAALGYSMAFFILLDNPELTAREAMARSREMMLGHRWRLFFLNLSYWGWILLSLLTLGVLFIWVLPRIAAANAVFYDELKSPPVDRQGPASGAPRFPNRSFP